MAHAAPTITACSRRTRKCFHATGQTCELRAERHVVTGIRRTCPEHSARGNRCGERPRLGGHVARCRHLNTACHGGSRSGQPTGSNWVLQERPLPTGPTGNNPMLAKQAAWQLARSGQRNAREAKSRLVSNSRPGMTRAGLSYAVVEKRLLFPARPELSSFEVRQISAYQRVVAAT